MKKATEKTYKVVSLKDQGIYKKDEVIRRLTTTDILLHYPFFEFSSKGYTSSFEYVQVIEEV